MKRFTVVMVTCASSKEARSISKALLKKRFVACATLISDVNSIFWWKGKINSAREVLILLKARLSNFKRIERVVKRLHSYKVPEIIAIPIVAGSKDYLDWIEGGTY